MLYHVICHPTNDVYPYNRPTLIQNIKREFALVNIHSPPPYTTNKVYNTCPTFGDDCVRFIFTLYDNCPNDFHNVGMLREKLKKVVPANYKIDIVTRK
jgi:hypothetical protein